jgi:hypothetical protein
MSAAPNNYQRLPGRGNQLAGYYQLYRGADHLLQVAFAGFNERYKRFFFRDIQAFIVIPTTTWLIYLSLCAIGFLAMLGIAFAVNDTVGNYVFGTLAGICLVAGVWQALAGPSCRCYVRTAVQMEHLPSLSRIRRAQKVIATVQPLIVASQAPLVTAAPAAALETFTPPAEPQPPVS